MDREQFEARLWHALAFLKEEALGALGAIGWPLLGTWAGVTVGLGLLLCYPVWQESSSMARFMDMVPGAFFISAHCAVIIAVPAAVANFLWRLFGWGTLVTGVLAPVAFVLTGVVLHPLLAEVGADLATTFLAAYEERGNGFFLGTIALIPGAVAPPSGATGSPEPNMGLSGGGPANGAMLAILLIPLAICAVVDLAYVSLEPAVLWSLAWFLAAVVLVLGLAIVAALAVSVPALAYNFYYRARERYDDFTSTDR